MTRRVLAVLVGGAVLQGCALSQQAASPRGRTVKILAVQGAVPAAGELIAVSPDSLWVLKSTEIVSMPLERVRKVEMRRSSIGGGHALGYAALVGLVTGAALTAACGSVEGSDCGDVLAGTLLAWVAVGGLLAIAVESSAKRSVPATDWQALRPYARFPQGLPDSLSRRAASGP